MHPLLINTLDYGGAGRACVRLHNALLEENVDSRLQVLEKSNYSINSSYQYNSINSKKSIKKRLSNKVKRILKEFWLYRDTVKPTDEKIFLLNRLKELEKFSFPYSSYDITLSEQYNSCDIINLHWVADYLDFSSFFTINKKPVVWTLHDMNPFTGGEHYEETIVGIDEKGFPLTRKRTIEEIKFSEKNLLIKQKALENFPNLNVVTPSNWLKSEALNSLILNSFPVSVIPNSLDINIFKPYDRQFSREILGLPKDKIIVLFIAERINNIRKGFEYLQRALCLLDNKNIHLCAVGTLNETLVTVKNITNLGKIYDERMLGLVYTAADIFIIPSLMDNLPNTVMESLACGTPVVGFNIGGIPEMVEDGKNGYLAPEISVSGLKETINKMVENYHLFNRTEISDNAHKKYNPEIQAKAYISLYKKILSNK